jgi:hypothetical protein
VSATNMSEYICGGQRAAAGTRQGQKQVQKLNCAKSGSVQRMGAMYNHIKCFFKAPYNRKLTTCHLQARDRWTLLFDDSKFGNASENPDCHLHHPAFSCNCSCCAWVVDMISCVNSIKYIHVCRYYLQQSPLEQAFKHHTPKCSRWWSANTLNRCGGIHTSCVRDACCIYRFHL